MDPRKAVDLNATEKATAYLNTISQVKNAHEVPNQKFALPMTTAQEYGWLSQVSLLGGSTPARGGERRRVRHRPRGCQRRNSLPSALRAGAAAEAADVQSHQGAVRRHRVRRLVL